MAEGAASERWSIEAVEALAPTPAAMSAALPLASPPRWRSIGADDDAVWGVFHGTGAEPYHTVVDHRAASSRCSCPSRRRPCKHALALLVMWVRHAVPRGVAPATVRRVVDARRPVDPTSDDGPTRVDGPTRGDGGPGEEGPRGSTGPSAEPADAGSDEDPRPPSRDDLDRSRDERVDKMIGGLIELDRWLADRVRTGLADPSIAQYSTWDRLAARLVDAQVGSLANRVRRLAGVVGSHPRWHDDVLAELGVLHLLARAGQRLRELPGPLADGVATTVGWQVRTADVLSGVPDTDRWIVAGRSDTREDRIEVRRWWLWGPATGRWALVLSFAAYRQSLDDSLETGTQLDADLHRYPGGALRALVGRRHDAPVVAAPLPAMSVDDAVASIGRSLVEQPWLDRLPAIVRVAPARRGSSWFLTDETGSLPLAPSATSGAPSSWSALLALSAGSTVDVVIEWTPHGVIPLTVIADGTARDIGPRADESFVRTA